MTQNLLRESGSDLQILWNIGGIGILTRVPARRPKIRVRTVFNPNYTKLLDQILRAERGTVRVYELLDPLLKVNLRPAHLGAMETLTHLLRSHQSLLPKDGHWPSDISQLIAKVTVSYSPDWLKSPANRRNCLALERYLEQKYERAYEMAPMCDRLKLYALLKATQRNITLIH